MNERKRALRELATKFLTLLVFLGIVFGVVFGIADAKSGHDAENFGGGSDGL